MKFRIFEVIILPLLVILPITSPAEKPRISVVYPKMNGRVAAVDSTFILGSVTPGANLNINGQKIKVYKDGGFIAFLPIAPGTFEFNLRAGKDGDTNTLVWPVQVPVPKRSFSFDSLSISEMSDSMPNLGLSCGDRLIVNFQATPGCVAYFSIPGIVDSVPMSERPPQLQSFWGEDLFGAGAVPETMKIAGIYQGFFDVGKEELHDSTRLCYHLKGPDYGQILERIATDPGAISHLNFLAPRRLFDKQILDSSSYYISINSPDWPRLVEFADSIQVMRVGPAMGYFSILQPKGTQAQAVGFQGDWLKLKLSATQYGWVKRSGAKLLDAGLTPTISYPKTIRTFSCADSLLIEIPLSAVHPFRVEEEDERTILIDLYGVVSNTDWIRYDFKDDYLDIASWVQMEPDRYRIKLVLTHPLWGYDAYYSGTVFKFKLIKPPTNVASLKSKIVVIDPGHSPDPGAIGPTGLKESEANLAIAKAVKRELEQRGARVILTRNDMSDLALNERPVVAVNNHADLFVSIHNNALPDGVDPFVNNGVSTYYYHPHSISLARDIQEYLLTETGLKDYGLYFGNLAVDRPTQYPAVLIECAFIILPEQEALLRTATFQDHIAVAVRKGIEKYLREYGKR
ncbi:conserved hypothetical protein [Candidatus Zixiibacteriota bacterium]|nr:conserved hypothetical protein [candidate division Zixibacteria bacterium]